jgi:hypothetical protein
MFTPEQRAILEGKLDKANVTSRRGATAGPWATSKRGTSSTWPTRYLASAPGTPRRWR